MFRNHQLCIIVYHRVSTLSQRRLRLCTPAVNLWLSVLSTETVWRFVLLFISYAVILFFSMIVLISNAWSLAIIDINRSYPFCNQNFQLYKTVILVSHKYNLRFLVNILVEHIEKPVEKLTVFDDIFWTYCVSNPSMLKKFHFVVDFSGIIKLYR